MPFIGPVSFPDLPTPSSKIIQNGLTPTQTSATLTTILKLRTKTTLQSAKRITTTTTTAAPSTITTTTSFVTLNQQFAKPSKTMGSDTLKMTIETVTPKSTKTLPSHTTTTSTTVSQTPALQSFVATLPTSVLTSKVSTTIIGMIWLVTSAKQSLTLLLKAFAPQARLAKTVLDAGFNAVDSGVQVLGISGFLSVELALRITIFSGIPGCLNLRALLKVQHQFSPIKFNPYSRVNGMRTNKF